MGDVTGSIWRLAGESLAVLFRAAPGYQAVLAPSWSMSFTGEASRACHGNIETSAGSIRQVVEADREDRVHAEQQAALEPV